MILEEESSHFQRIQSLNWRGILLYLLCVGIRGAIHAALTFMQILSHLRFQIMEVRTIENRNFYTQELLKKLQLLWTQEILTTNW